MDRPAAGASGPAPPPGSAPPGCVPPDRAPSHHAPADSALPDRDEAQKRLETLLWPWVQAVVTDWDVPGLAVAVVHHGDQVVTRGFGTRDRDTGEPVAPDTCFHLASISKTFVATAVLQLVELGQLDLQAGVTAYLPQLEWADERAAAVTLAHLLSHTAGVDDVTDYGWHEPERDDGALGRLAAQVAGWPLLRPPGSGFSYSNAAYDLLGHLVATVSGQSFEEHLHEHVLDRVGMHGSTYLLDEVPSGRAAAPHLGLPPRVVGGTYPYTRRHAPSSTLHSSAVDMARWMAVHLAGGSGLMQPATHRQMWAPRADTGVGDEQEQVALGWFWQRHGERTVVGHSGSDPGFESVLKLVPDLGLGVTVLANTNVVPVDAVAQAAWEVLLGAEPPAPPVLTPDDRYATGVWGLIEVHRTDLAWPLLEEWREVLPQSPECWFMTGWSHAVEQRHAAAVQHLERALELDPGHDEALALLRRLTRKGPAAESGIRAGRVGAGGRRSGPHRHMWLP